MREGKTYRRNLNLMEMFIVATVMLIFYLHFMVLLGAEGYLLSVYWVIQLIGIFILLRWGIFSFDRIYVGSEGIKEYSVLNKNLSLSYGDIKSIKKKKTSYVLYLKDGTHEELNQEYFYNEFRQEEFENVLRKNRIKLHR